MGTRMRLAITLTIPLAFGVVACDANSPPSGPNPDFEMVPLTPMLSAEDTATDEQLDEIEGWIDGIEDTHPECDSAKTYAMTWAAEHRTWLRTNGDSGVVRFIITNLLETDDRLGRSPVNWSLPHYHAEHWKHSIFDECTFNGGCPWDEHPVSNETELLVHETGGHAAFDLHGTAAEIMLQAWTPQCVTGN